MGTEGVWVLGERDGLSRIENRTQCPTLRVRVPSPGGE